MKLSTALKVELQNQIGSIDAQVAQLGKDRAAVLHLLDSETVEARPVRNRGPVRATPRPVAASSSKKPMTPPGETTGAVLDVIADLTPVKPLIVIRSVQSTNKHLSRSAIYGAIAALKKQGKITQDDSRSLVTV